MNYSIPNPHRSCHIRRLPLIISGIVAHLVFFSAAAQTTDSDTRRISVTSISEEITIDGSLNEGAWKSAPKIGSLVQRQPNPGGRPSEKTEVTLLYDSDYLYIGVVAYDSELDDINSTQMARDASLSSDDQIEILLDTFRDRQNAFYFSTNPDGALVDGLAFGNKDLNTDWNAIWDLRTQRTEDGWTAEIAIPFKSLNFPSDSSVWGFNIQRSIFRKQEENVWSGARLETDFLQVSEAGDIENLSGLNQGIGLDVRPFLASSWTHSRGDVLSPGGSDSDDEFDFEPGLDVFWNITPSLKLTGTLNTDFGETEVDAREINLDRFSIRFPEKRSFFLEDVGVFDFASTGPEPPGGAPSTGADVFPFFSRRIGLFNGEEVPVDVGVKLTGKVANTDIGILGVQTGSTTIGEGSDNARLIDDNTFYVGRFKQRIFEQSYIGGIFTDGNSNPEISSNTYGADVRLQTSNFMGDKGNFIVDGYALKADNEGVSEDDLSYGFSARYPNDKWDAMVVFKEIQDNFTPGIGFVQRDNVRMYRVAGSYNPRPKDFLDLQQMFHDIYYTYFENLDTGEKESTQLYITPLDWHFRSGDSIHALIDYDRRYERLFEPWAIVRANDDLGRPAIVLPAGEYHMDRSRMVFASARKRPLSGTLIIGYGDFWSGSSEEVSLSLAYNLPPHLTVSLRANQTFAHLPQGDFITRIFTGTFNYAVSPRLTFSNLIQYDNNSRNMGWQSRVRWTISPGNDLFISFNQGWISDPFNGGRFVAQSTKIAGKLQYTFRF